MIAALVAHVIDDFAAATDALGVALQSVNTPEEMVELLYSDGHENDPRLMLAWQALTASAADHQGFRRPMLDSYFRFLDVIAATLRRLSPDASDNRVRAAAQGIASALVNLDAMSPLAPPAEWRDELKRAALILAASLE